MAPFRTETTSPPATGTFSRVIVTIQNTKTDIEMVEE